MKILQVISGREVNGALVHVDLLARELSQRGHQITVLCRPRSWIRKRFEGLPIGCRESELKRLPPSELVRVGKWIRDEGFDVIHTHMSSAHFFGVLLKKLTGVPSVATAHTFHFQLHWRMNDLVIANSQATRRFHARYNRVPKKKLVTIPCFIDREKFGHPNSRVRQQAREEFGVHDDRPLIGIVGSVEPRKGQREFIESLPQLIDRFPGIQVVFLGGHNRDSRFAKRLRNRLHQLRLFRRVIWAGARENVHELIQGFDAVAVPSLKEPLGLCALEAMATGIPVAASNRGGLRELVIPDQTGLQFDPQSPGDIADAITRILTDADLRSRVVSHARQMVETDFSPATLTQQIESALHSVLPLAASRRAA